MESFGWEWECWFGCVEVGIGCVECVLIIGLGMILVFF